MNAKHTAKELSGCLVSRYRLNRSLHVHAVRAAVICVRHACASAFALVEEGSSLEV